ncbi:MAG TPA: serine hydrolase [Deltaproteobacteria bacterium]|mgnify:CR=1 FL=1|jgi:hypothetical protein|nr:serine hydrolase [Deltaproteobacteria bacterium]HOI06178.1 serine hydrolase [Deltaproteobacteria bacterium]
MERSRKRAWWTAGLLSLALVAAAAYLIVEVAPIGTAYAAKRLCSGVFVSGREPAAVLAEELEPYGYVSTLVDFEEKTVTCTILGMAKRKAVFREGLGSTLAVGISLDGLLRQTRGLTPTRRDRIDLPWPDGDLVKIGPLPVNIDAVKLSDALDRALEEPDPSMPRRTRAVVVVYGGRIIAERYASGFTESTPQLGWSMTKSVTALLAGVLVMQGRLNVAAPADVPEWGSPGDPRGRITLDQLLRMSSGLMFDEDYQDPCSDVARMLFAEADAGGYAASKGLMNAPDTRWKYSSGTTNIISRIVRRAAGESLPDFFLFPRRALFDPIGMTSAVMEPDPTGTFVGSSFMYATPRDWARLGLLCLNDGVWNGVRILPEGWMKYCTTPTPGARQGKYGAQFWLNAGSPGHPEDRWMPRVPPDMCAMRGFEGQYVTIIPSKRLVVVRMGLSANEESWDQESFLADILAALPD